MPGISYLDRLVTSHLFKDARILARRVRTNAICFNVLCSTTQPSYNAFPKLTPQPLPYLFLLPLLSILILTSSLPSVCSKSLIHHSDLRLSQQTPASPALMTTPGPSLSAAPIANASVRENLSQSQGLCLPNQRLCTGHGPFALTDLELELDTL